MQMSYYYQFDYIRNYFNMWNLIDLTRILLHLLFICDIAAIHTFCVIILLAGVGILKHLQMYHAFRLINKLIKASLVDMLQFLIVLFVIIISFSAAFFFKQKL